MLCNEILFGNSIRRPSGYQLKRGYYIKALDNCSIARQISGLILLMQNYIILLAFSSNINLEVHTED
ncbi:hypothetical protein SUGI_0461360 [Cryptomeria japonica]|nr:hypothetical protein SUGI_0461360 [Cryptomeria japonica]